MAQKYSCWLLTRLWQPLPHLPPMSTAPRAGAGRRGRRGDMAGGFTLMAREDMRRVAPLWLKYTERVREDPMAFNLTGDEWAKKPGARGEGRKAGREGRRGGKALGHGVQMELLPVC